MDPETLLGLAIETADALSASSEREFDGAEVVAVLSFDHLVRMSPMQSGLAIGRMGDRIGERPRGVSSGFRGCQRFVELGFGGGAAGEALGEDGPLL